MNINEESPSLNRGVYIVANDRVADNAIALLSSLRIHDPDLPVFMIPFDGEYHYVADVLKRYYQVELFPDLDFLEAFTEKIGEIFPRDFLKLPNKMRKLSAWFGPLQDFLYIDTDIILFRPVSEVLDFLRETDFLTCDFHHKGRGLNDVFSTKILDLGIFSDQELKDVFNSGFWGSRKGLISLDEMSSLLAECAKHREYFDFSSGTTDQPVMNYLVLKSMRRRLNLTRKVENEPGSWGGSSHFTERKNILFDGDRSLRYLHWAGTPMRVGGPYRKLWEYYRFRNCSLPLTTETDAPKLGFVQKIRRQIKNLVS
ncbi:MAG: Npun_R2821/Npun_R2822 family protein [Leptolyngbyaceae cyanobacterium]